MRNKILILVLFSLVVNVACPICGGGDRFFDVIDIRVNLSTTDYGTVIESQAINGVSSEQLRLNLYVEYNSFSSAIPFQSPFMTSAFACSPAPPSPIQEILSIHIYSDTEFTMGGTSYPVGTALDELFDINEGYYYNENYESLVGFNDNGNPAATLEPLTLKLNQAVDVEQTHQFKIVYTHTDGQLEEAFEQTYFRVKLL